MSTSIMVDPLSRATPAFAPFPREALEHPVHARFEQQVRRYPHRLAVRTEKHEFTYLELNQAANRVAHQVLNSDARDDAPVALLLEDGALLVVAILGTLKAGKAYVPLDPSFPRQRLASMLEHSLASLILTESGTAGLADVLTGASQHCSLGIDRLDSPDSSDDPRLALLPETVAYIMYTSGSTGHPKGVIHSHRNVLHKTMSYTNDFGISTEDRVALLTSCSSSVSMKDIFGVLLNGASLHPFDVRQRGLAPLVNWLGSEEISCYFSVPTVFRRFAGLLTGRENFSRLRLIQLGGEVVTRQDVELYKRNFPADCILVNRLGSSETGTIARCIMDKNTPVTENVVPVGYQTLDMEVTLIGDGGEVVGDDQVGEIFVKSPYLALGYWREPELTRMTFHSGTAAGNARTYRTGDLGRRLPDGRLVYLGRKDFRVKIRGNGVELVEVEAALLSSGSIKEVAVVARDDPSGEQCLVAYVVPETTIPPGIDQLRRTVSKCLPLCMVPSSFVFLERLPLTPNGKVDRLALTVQDTTPPAGRAFVPPRDALERHLKDLWQDILKSNRVGIRDDFLELGGDSLMALELLDKIEHVFGTRLPVDMLWFHAPTIEQLANTLREERSSHCSRLEVLKPGGARIPLFCAHTSGGNLFHYHDLARHLDRDQPVFGLQARGVYGDGPPDKQIEIIAEDCCRTMLERQPEGPYHICGCSSGGVVAFEIAQQLEAQGREVGLLALLDTFAPGDAAYPRLLRKVFPNARSSINWRHIQERLYHLVLHGTRLGNKRRFRTVGEAHRWAHWSYTPRPYPNRIHFFAAEQPTRFVSNPQYAWNRLVTGGLEVCFVRGSHYSMMKEPYVRDLAGKMQECLSRNSCQYDAPSRRR